MKKPKPTAKERMKEPWRTKLRVLLRGRRRTSREMARTIGVHESFVAKWWNGTAGMSLDTAKKVAAFLDVSVETLINNEPLPPEVVATFIPDFGQAAPQLKIDHPSQASVSNRHPDTVEPHQNLAHIPAPIGPRAETAQIGGLQAGTDVVEQSPVHGGVNPTGQEDTIAMLDASIRASLHQLINAIETVDLGDAQELLVRFVATRPPRTQNPRRGLQNG